MFSKVYHKSLLTLLVKEQMKIVPAGPHVRNETL